jgi:hypothetical protein
VVSERRDNKGGMINLKCISRYPLRILIIRVNNLTISKTKFLFESEKNDLKAERKHSNEEDNAALSLEGLNCCSAENAVSNATFFSLHFVDERGGIRVFRRDKRSRDDCK